MYLCAEQKKRRCRNTDSDDENQADKIEVILKRVTKSKFSMKNVEIDVNHVPARNGTTIIHTLRFAQYVDHIYKSAC